MNKTPRIKTIWLEFEQWAPGEWNPSDGNSDVLVTLDDGSTWGATFFTYSNIETIRRKNAESGDCMSGAYFWATDVIFIDSLTRARIEEVIVHLMTEGEFETVFAEMEPDEEES